MAVNLALAATIRSFGQYTSPDPGWASRDQPGYECTNLKVGLSWRTVVVAPGGAHPDYAEGLTIDLGSFVQIDAIALRYQNLAWYLSPLHYGLGVHYSCGIDELIGPNLAVPMDVNHERYPDVESDEWVNGIRILKYYANSFSAQFIYLPFQLHPDSWLVDASVRVDGLFIGTYAGAQEYVVPPPPPVDVVPGTLVDLKDNHAPPVTVLVDVEPVQRLPEPWVPKDGTTDTWTNNTAADNPPPTTGAGSSYSYPLVTSVTVDGTAMTSVAVGATDATNNSWAYDPDTGVVDLNYSTGSDPNPHMVVLGIQLFFCSGNPTGGEIYLNGHEYLPYLASDGLPKVVLALQDPLFGGASSQVGDITFINADGKFDALAARFRWESQQATIRFGGGDLPFSEYYTMPPAVIYGTKWTEDRFTLYCRSAVDQLMTSVPAQDTVVAADISRNYLFTHELVASVYGNSKTTVARHTRALSKLAPYTRSPVDVDSNALANAPIGAVKPLTYGTCYGVKGVVLAQSSTERMVLLSANGIHQLLDVVNKDGARASQAYHQHGGGLASVFSDGVYRSEVRVDLTYGVVHEVFDDTLSDVQADPLETTPWFLNSGGIPFLYDLEGEEADDGTLMSNPADVVAALVAQSELSVTINATKQIEARVDADLYSTSLVIPDAAKLQDVITPLLKAISGAVYVDDAGTVSLMLMTPSMAPDHTLVEETGDFWDLEVGSDTSQVLTSVVLTYPAPVQGGRATVETASIPEASYLRSVEALESFEAPLDGLTSNYLAAVHILHRRMKPTSLAYLTSGMQIVDVQPGEVVKLVKDRLPTDALSYIIGQVQKVELDGNTMVNRLTVDDSKTVLETPFQAFLEADDTSLDWTALTAAQRIERGFWTDDNDYVVTADTSTLRRSMYY